MFQSYDRKPSLQDGYNRANRAKQHLTRLKREINTFWRLNPNLAVTVGAGLKGIFIPEGLTPAIIVILIGEMVYNLRAALDYLIYEMALLDSGQVQKDTQFPIVDQPSGWEQSCRKRLKGLSRKHKAAIRALQPFCGCNWTRTLRDISNPDKHRHLIVARVGVRVRVNTLIQSQIIKSPARRAKNWNGNPTLQMLFDDGSPILETLQVLQRKVSDVLDTFDSDF